MSLSHREPGPRRVAVSDWAAGMLRMEVWFPACLVALGLSFAFALTVAAGDAPARLAWAAFALSGRAFAVPYSAVVCVLVMLATAWAPPYEVVFSNDPRDRPSR